jgi:hypothetical protein
MTIMAIRYLSTIGLVLFVKWSLERIKAGKM